MANGIVVGMTKSWIAEGRQFPQGMNTSTSSFFTRHQYNKSIIREISNETVGKGKFRNDKSGWVVLTGNRGVFIVYVIYKSRNSP